jgi:hypothetical protein
MQFQGKDFVSYCMAFIRLNECSSAFSPKSFVPHLLCLLPGTMPMMNLSRSSTWRITDILRCIVLIGPVTSTIDLATIFLNCFSHYPTDRYAYQRHRCIPVRFGFFKGQCAGPSWFASFALANSQLYQTTLPNRSTSVSFFLSQRAQSPRPTFRLLRAS